MFDPSVLNSSTLDSYYRDACRAAETGQHAAQGIGQAERGLAAVIQRAQQPTSQGVVIEVALVTSTIEVAMFLQPEGIDGHGGATAIGGAAQDTIARSIVDIEVLVGRASVPTDEVIQEVIGERRGGAAVRTAGDVAPAIVTAGVDGTVWLARIVAEASSLGTLCITTSVSSAGSSLAAVLVYLALAAPSMPPRDVPKYVIHWLSLPIMP